MWTADEGLPGADQRTRAMALASSSFRGTRAPAVIPGRAAGASPESIRRSMKKDMSAVPNTSTAAYGFRVRPFGPPRNDGMFASE